MRDEDEKARGHPEVQVGRQTSHKFIGYGISVLLTALAFSLVYAHALSTPALKAVLSFIALITICVQLYYFSNMDIRHTQRFNVISILLTVPLFMLMIALTVWLFYALSFRVEVPL